MYLCALRTDGSIIACTQLRLSGFLTNTLIFRPNVRTENLGLYAQRGHSRFQTNSSTWTLSPKSVPVWVSVGCPGWWNLVGCCHWKSVSRKHRPSGERGYMGRGRAAPSWSCSGATLVCCASVSALMETARLSVMKWKCPENAFRILLHKFRQESGSFIPPNQLTGPSACPNWGSHGSVPPGESPAWWKENQNK